MPTTYGLARRRPIGPHVATIVAAITGLTAGTAPRAGAEPCPENGITCATSYPETYLISQEPRAELSCAGYDLPMGSFWVAASGGSPDQPGGAGLRATDEYALVGAPMGNPIPLEVQLHVVGTGGGAGTCNWGSGFGDLQIEVVDVHGQSSARIDFYSPSGPCNETGCCSGSSANLDSLLTLHVVVDPAVPLRLEFSLYAIVGAGAASAQVSLAFGDLPPGVSIASCQGYVEEAPVQVAATSWGRVKALYR